MNCDFGSVEVVIADFTDEHKDELLKLGVR